MSMVSFKQYLYETEGIYDVMRSSIEDRIRSAHREKHELGVISDPTLKQEHIKPHNLHSVLLNDTPSRTKMSYKKYGSRYTGSHATHQYLFLVKKNNKFDKSSPIVQTFIETYSENEQNGHSPKHRIDFAIDGNAVHQALDELDFDSHHAVYSGVMDAIAHHHYETGSDPNSYVFNAHAKNSQKERAKSRRYKKIAQVLKNK